MRRERIFVGVRKRRYRWTRFWYSIYIITLVYVAIFNSVHYVLVRVRFLMPTLSQKLYNSFILGRHVRHIRLVGVVFVLVLHGIRGFLNHVCKEWDDVALAIRYIARSALVYSGLIHTRMGVNTYSPTDFSGGTSSPYLSGDACGLGKFRSHHEIVDFRRFVSSVRCCVDVLSSDGSYSLRMRE